MEISKIVKDLELTQKVNTFNDLLDLKPKPEWIKANPVVKTKVNGQWKQADYIPINTVRKIARKIFPVNKTEIREIKDLFNSIIVIVRFHYIHPVSGEWEWTDGLGAAPMQTDKGAKAMDSMSLKHDAIQKAAPTAKSLAVKNALKELGDIFGAGLDSEDDFEVEEVYAEPLPEIDENELQTMLDACTTVEDLRELYSKVSADHYMGAKESEMFSARTAVIGDKAKKAKPAPEETKAPEPEKPADPEAAKMEPKKLDQASFFDELNGQDEQIVKKALESVKAQRDVMKVYNELMDKGVNVKAFSNLFSDKFNELK